MISLSEHFTYKKLVKFTLPTIVMMIFTSIYGVVDGLFISNVVKGNAFASVNLIMPALMIVGTIGFMFGTGGSAIISKTLGEGDIDKANRYFSLLIYSEVVLGILFTVFGVNIFRTGCKIVGCDKGFVARLLNLRKNPFVRYDRFYFTKQFSIFFGFCRKARLRTYNINNRRAYKYGAGFSVYVCIQDGVLRVPPQPR